ncbi:MAG TPA: response regulator [Bryobacteraceae bacterium]|nr:response regulator [Bryobacteraceae bacterium]
MDEQAQTFEEAATGKRARLLATALEASAALVVLSDAEGRIVHSNRGCEQITGYSSQELKGRVLWEVFVPPESQAVARSHFGSVLYSEAPSTWENDWIAKSGELRRIVLSHAIAPGEDGAGRFVISTGIDITAHQHAEPEAGQNETRFRLIWNAALEPMCVNDLEGTIVAANDAFARLVRKPALELAGTRIAGLFGRDQERKLKAFYAGVEEHAGCSIVLSLPSGEGRGSCYEIVASRLEAGGQTAQFLSAFRDVSQREAQAEELARAREMAADTSRDLMAANRYLEETGTLAQELAEEAAALRQAKSAFLSNMTHEIRTPLNGILGMLELAGSDALPAEQRECMELAKQSAQTLLNLASDVLDYARYEAGKLTLASEHFSLDTLLQQTLGPMAERAAAKHLPLEWSLEAATPALLIGDPQRLTEVLTKLVSNAIKFTAQGKIGVQVRAVPTRQSSVELYFTVADTGIGIPVEKQSAIFQPFTQADGTLTRPYGGAGLGLSIASILVERMGGRMWLESAPGRGSKFHFTVVLERPGLLKGPQRRVPSKIKQRILIAEDNIVNQRLAARLLEREGHQVEIAASGKQALDLLEGKQFDLVLMDIQMPEMDGLQATAQIRRKERGSGQRIPIIAITAQASESDRQRCFEAGMDAYMTKPVRVPELMSMIESLIPGGSYMNADANGHGSIEDQLKQLDESLALSRVGGDRGLLREVTELFLNDYPDMLEKLRTAISARDASALEHYAHSLKGSVSTFGAKGAFDAALALEKKGRSGELSDVEEGLRQLEYALGTLKPELETLQTR